MSHTAVSLVAGQLPGSQSLPPTWHNDVKVGCRGAPEGRYQLLSCLVSSVNSQAVEFFPTSFLFLLKRHFVPPDSVLASCFLLRQISTSTARTLIGNGPSCTTSPAGGPWPEEPLLCVNYLPSAAHNPLNVLPLSLTGSLPVSAAAIAFNPTFWK